MVEHVMHPSAEIYGKAHARDSYISVEYHIDGPLQVIWIHAHDGGTGEDALVEIPKATFDRFIAEYLSAHGETWIG